ncbi:MAG: hypothetical protein ACLPZR_06895 [Solirubrobacteraceae bacterium]
MSFDRESDGIGELGEDVLRAAILIGTRLAQRHQQQRAQRLQQAAQQSQDVRERELRIQAMERQRAIAGLAGVRSEAWWAHADAHDIRTAWTTARDWQAEDPRAQQAVYRIADELHARWGLDVRQTDPSAFGEQPALPAQTTLSAEELAAYDQHLQHELENVNEQRVRLAGEDPEQRQASDQQTLAQVDERAGQLSELRDLIADEFADRQQAEGTLQPSGTDQRRSEERELASAELRTGSPAFGGAAAVGTAAAGEVLYDSQQRRDHLRQRLQEAGLPDQAVQARLLSDAGQGLPAIEAAAAHGTGPRARPATRNPKGRAPSPRQRRR